MDDHKYVQPHIPLPEHTEKSKVKDASKISAEEILGNPETEKEHGFKEGLADNSNNQPPGAQQK